MYEASLARVLGTRIMDIFYEVRQGNVDHVRRWLASVENDPNCTSVSLFRP